MPSQGEIGSSSSSLPNGVSHTHLPKSIFRSLKSDRKTPGTSWSQQRHQQTQSISIYPHSMIAEQSDSKNSQRTIDPVRVYGKTTTAIRERIADLREQVRVDELALKSGNDDHIHKLKGSLVVGVVCHRRIPLSNNGCTRWETMLQVSAIWGQSIWSTPIVFLFGHQWILSEVLSLMTLATLSNAIISNASFVLLNVKTPLDRLGVNIPRKKGLITILPAIPVILLTLIMMIAYNYGYYHVNCTMFILTFGFTYAKLTMKLVIAHCTKSDLELADPALVAPILMTLTHLAMGEPMIAPNKALLCALICNTIELIRYFTSVSWDLRLALDVDIFAVRYPPEHEKSRRHCGGFYITGLNNQEVLSRNK
ncbi:hypothetical protein RDWZM_006397 [Blomia tropicalis]|uniref:Uncharacterized protein n=1 Tax=Blomia tropicalis TaxID=40697 RepID=A0A9Q0RNI6_BLOTA|nr:hypothetical protein RDWZM_006397 [Blomia tropicalis]